MQCPLDGTELKIAFREGIEIDCCPRCRGVWLDRGELDKIIEQTAAARQPAAALPSRESRDSCRCDDNDDDDRYPKKKKRRSSFLEELFDF